MIVSFCILTRCAREFQLLHILTNKVILKFYPFCQASVVLILVIDDIELLFLCKSFNFILLYQSCFGTSRFFIFSDGFQNQLITFYKNACWDFLLELCRIQINLRRIKISKVLVLLIHEQGISLFTLVFSQQFFVASFVKFLYIFSQLSVF